MSENVIVLDIEYLIYKVCSTEEDFNAIFCN